MEQSSSVTSAAVELGNGHLPLSAMLSSKISATRQREAATVATKELEMRPLTRTDSDDSQYYERFVDNRVLSHGSSGSTNGPLRDFLFPPNLPPSCQLLRMRNIAIPACYLMVGILQGLSGPFMNAYPRDIHALEAQQTVISAVRSLPASCKLFFGFLSDTLPLCGKRRKSYMTIGWILASLSVAWLLRTSNLAFERFDDKGLPVPPDDAPSIPKLAASLLLFGTGFWMADVMGDSLVAEKAKLEPEHARGSIQSSCYAYRFFGLMVAAPCSTLLYKIVGPQAVVAALVSLPLSIIPLIWFLEEPTVAMSCCARNSASGHANPQPVPAVVSAVDPHHEVFHDETDSIDDDIDLRPIPTATAVPANDDAQIMPTIVVPTVRKQCNEIWNTVCQRAVWQPLGFVYVYNVLQVGNAAWKEFLVTGLGFTSFQLNILYNVGVVLLYFGVVTYKYYLIHWSWRTIYIACTALNAIFSSLQLLLIAGTTFGIPPFWFALGDDVFADFIAGIQFLPTTIMMVHLCPTGSEGASYAMFTTVNNSALTLSSAISTQLLSIWNVAKTEIEKGDYTGITKLTVLTTILQLSGILFVGWLPHTKEDLVDLKRGTSKVGGCLFLIVTFGSIAYAITIGVLAIVKPGSLGES